MNLKALSFGILTLVIVGIIFFGRCVTFSNSEPSYLTAETTPSNHEMQTKGFLKEVTYQSESTLKGYLCKPEGSGPFPAVIYNHGGKGGIIGGAPKETCEALAKAGFVGFSPIRREELSLKRNLDDVFAGIKYVRTLDYVDSDLIGIIGFSRGGFLTFLAASQEPDFKAIIIMASAPPSYSDEEFYSDASKISAPVLILVAENDLPSKINGYQNLVESAEKMKDTFKAAGKNVQLIIYPPYKDNGHLMFFEVGDYWKDVVEFLQRSFLKDV
ncbi:MAG: dienelactone hydrolase family protein [Candidatus Methanofastidiosia archaeon]